MKHNSEPEIKFVFLKGKVTVVETKSKFTRRRDEGEE